MGRIFMVYMQLYQLQDNFIELIRVMQDVGPVPQSSFSYITAQLHEYLKRERFYSVFLVQVIALVGVQAPWETKRRSLELPKWCPLESLTSQL